MKKQNNPASGVALIIVLGMLAILLLLSVTFFSTMRLERLVSRNYADEVRARHLAHVALVRAMEDVDDTMIGHSCYPCWIDRSPTLVADAMSSDGTVANSGILTGEASNLIPCALWNDTITAASNCYWRDVTNGRISYLVVNCSGLLDANIVGGTNRTCSTNVHELSLRHLPDMVSTSTFYACRNRDRRYETIPELANCNTGVTDQISDLFVYSYDPDRDVYFTNVNELGSEDIGLLPKLNINDTTALNYLDRLTNALIQAGFTNKTSVIEDAILDYLDADHIPRNTDFITEAVPLVNEVALQAASSGTSNEYEFVVELWFPFFPTVVTATDGFWLKTSVYTSPATNAPLISDTHQIMAMQYGEPNKEFLTFTSGVFSVISNGTNVPISTNNPVWFRGYVVITNGVSDIIIDPAMGNTPFEFTGANDYSINDPRLGAEPTNWVVAASSFGKNNDNICDPWSNAGQGVPIHQRDGPMQSIGEVGYIFTGDPWRDIQLVDYRPDQDFALPDLLTVRSNSVTTRGLVNISSQQKDVLTTLFYDMWIGDSNQLWYAYSNQFGQTAVKLSAVQKNQLWGSINGPFINFRDLFNQVVTATNGNNYSGWNPCYPKVPANTNACNDIKEDAFRNILEMVTFRQNIFTVIVAAQVYAPVGTNVVAEKRAVAVVYRDAYTGRSFTRFFKWLQE
jgi:Tfp pilus assembly protein PilX